MSRDKKSVGNTAAKSGGSVGENNPEHPIGAGGKAGSAAARSGAALPHPPQPKTRVTMKGQRYTPPAGRHSQQTHRRAEQRAAELANTPEPDPHAHDRKAAVAVTSGGAAAKGNRSKRKDDGPGTTAAA